MPNGQFSYQESTMNMTVDKVLYTGQAHTAGGRNGAFKTRSNDQKARLARAVGPGGSDLSRCRDCSFPRDL
jgi:hypothetical protein